MVCVCTLFFASDLCYNIVSRKNYGGVSTMNYTESLAYLDSLGKFGIKLGMERIEGLLRELGNPE